VLVLRAHQLRFW